MGQLYLGAVVSDDGFKSDDLCRTKQAAAVLTKLTQFEEIKTYLLDHR